MTIINLSRSGQQKLSQFLFDYCSFMIGLRKETTSTIGFNESDFEGCVVLTVKEARKLVDLLLHAEDQRRVPYGHDTCDEWAQLITNRIKQA